MAEPILKLGRQQQWEVVPPYQLLESAQIASPQDPRTCSWSPWLRTHGASKKNTSPMTK